MGKHMYEMLRFVMMMQIGYRKAVHDIGYCIWA